MDFTKIIYIYIYIYIYTVSKETMEFWVVLPLFSPKPILGKKHQIARCKHLFDSGPCNMAFNRGWGFIMIHPNLQHHWTVQAWLASLKRAATLAVGKARSSRNWKPSGHRSRDEGDHRRSQKQRWNQMKSWSRSPWYLLKTCKLHGKLKVSRAWSTRSNRMLHLNSFEEVQRCNQF